MTYIYKVLGRYIPFIPENPGDAYDPSKPGTNRPPVLYDETPEEPTDNPPLPYIPGYTPKDPSGNPLVPVIQTIQKKDTSTIDTVSKGFIEGYTGAV